MRLYKKFLKTLLIVDLILITGVLCLCFAVDKSAESVEEEISLTMEAAGAAGTDKSDIFDEDIYSRRVIPSGEAMGIYMKTQGVLVVDICSFKGEDGENCCPAEGILRTGDYILSVDGTEVDKRSELLNAVAEGDGRAMRLEYERDGEISSAEIVPEKNENGNYLLGAWVKDDVSGIGTMTFIDGVNFMALGHGVSDVDTGLTMSCSTGGVYTTSITNISKSYSSEPGRLQGSISYKQSLVGIIDGNSESGIYGHLSSSYCSSKYADTELLYIAHGYEVTEGRAYIYSRVTGEPERYTIDIECVNGGAEDKNIEFKVTDSRLLELTGGVVQGMSGSPIVQNGKIIGAVTHVFVDDPTRGYGIFIERMLE